MTKNIDPDRLAQLQCLARAVEQTEDSVFITNHKGVIEYVNQGFERITGYARGEAVGQTPALLKSDSHDSGFYQRLWQTILSGRVFRELFTNRRKDSALYREAKTITPVKDETGRITHFISTGKDVSERLRIEEQLRESEERFRQVTENIREVFWLTTPDKNQMLYISPAYEAIWGRSCESLYAEPRSWLAAIHPEDHGRVLRAALADQASGRYAVEYRILRPDGSERWILDRAFPIRNTEGEVYRIAGIAEDVTERRHAEQTIQRLAYRDPLTGLSNRAAVQERLRQGLTDAKAKGQTLALLLLDLNNFREVNDTLGHPVGDQVLIQVAARLKDILWESDMVARLAGDEFAVLLPRLADRSHIELVTRKIVEGFKAPFVVAEVPLDVQPSVGVALYPEHGTDADTLFQHADVALNTAKTQHQTHVIYTAAVDHYNPQQLRLMAELRAAIAQDELVLHYQPKLGLQNNDIIGVEALVRWRHPKRGLLPPVEFIPIAEKTGLIDDLTRWVIKAALQQAQQWRDIGFPIKIALNISARNLQDGDFVQQIMEMFSRTASDPKQLVFEITESAMMLDPVGAKRKLNQLHQFGVSFAIDDFGTGYSSLSYLMELPVNQLKIDKSFVAHMAEPGSAAIVRSTIDLAHNLDISVVAEGVEQQWQADQLRDMGCDAGQGYYFSHPVPPDELEAWWRKRRDVLAEE